MLNILWKIFSASGHPRCRWVCFSIRKVLEKFRITCSPMDPLQSMGAVRRRFQKPDKNIRIIHTTPVNEVLWNEKVCFCMEQNRQNIFHLNHRFRPKYKSIIHNNASNSEKFHPLFSSHIQMCFGLFLLIVLDWCIFLSWFRWDYFFDWRKQYYRIRTCSLAKSSGLKLKTSQCWICFLHTEAFNLTSY